MPQRWNQKCYRLDRDKKLQPGGALGTLVLVECGRIAVRGTMRRMPAEVRMHAGCVVVTVVVIVEVRVQQRCTQCRQLQRHDRRDRHEGAKHPLIVAPKKSEEFLKSSSEAAEVADYMPEYEGMRTIQWLFVVGVLLFITGIGFVIAGAREARSAGPAVEAAPITTPVASVKQIMAAITGPAANTVYNSVGTIVSATGIKETAPQNDEEWAALAATAAALVESGNLMLTPGRAIDNGDWVKMTQDMIEKGKLVIKAAEAKSTEGILSSGSDLNVTCDNCHERYQRQ